MIYCGSAHAHALAVTFCYEDNEQAPYLFGDQSVPKTNPGILVDLIRDASQQANITPRFIRRPWLRCQKMVQLGQVQALFAMIETPERLPLFQFPNNKQHYLMKGNYVIFYNPAFSEPAQMERVAQGLAQDQGVGHLLKFGLGAPRGYVVTKLLARHNALVEGVHLLPQGLNLLKKARLDGFVMDKFIGIEFVFKNRGEAQIAYSAKSVLVDYWYATFNRSFYEMRSRQVEKFWLALPELRQKYESRLEQDAKFKMAH